MATCEEVELRLLELLREDPPRDLMLHVKSCPSCQEKREEWARLWSLMDRWEMDKPSDHVGASILSEIGAALQRETAQRRRLSWRNIAETLAPLAAATAVAFLGVALAVKKVGPAIEPLSPLALLTCGVVWMAVYSVMFFLSFEKTGGVHRIQGVQTSTFAKHALVALGLWLIFTALMEFSGVANVAAELFSPRVGVGWYFLLGAAYSFIPLVSGPLLLREEKLGRAWAHGTLLGGFLLFLMVPEVILYCSSFSLGIAFSWTVGTILGCLSGGPVGVWLSSKATRGLPA